MGVLQKYRDVYYMISFWVSCPEQKKKKNSTYFLDIVHYILEARILRIYEYKEKWETMVNIWLIQAKNICLTCFFNDGLIMGNKHPLN